MLTKLGTDYTKNKISKKEEKIDEVKKRPKSKRGRKKKEGDQSWLKVWPVMENQICRKI